DPHGDVAIISRREALVVKPPADLADVLFDSMLICHGYSNDIPFMSFRSKFTLSNIAARYASTGFTLGLNADTASPPSLKQTISPTPAPRSSHTTSDSPCGAASEASSAVV